MASNNNFLVMFAIVVAVVLPTVTVATEHLVGDNAGWTVNFDYQDWAKDKVFHVGDTLVFKYPVGKHNVFKVNGTGFQDCIVPPPTLALATGNDVIPLTTPGRKWYICGVGQHCAQLGQKLAITVVEGGAPAPAPTGSSASAIMTSGLQTLIAAATATAVIAVAMMIV